MDNIEIRITNARWYHKLLDIFNKPKKSKNQVIATINVDENGKVNEKIQIPKEHLKEDDLEAEYDTMQKLVNVFNGGKTEYEKALDGIREYNGSNHHDLLRPIQLAGFEDGVVYLQDPYSKKKFYLNMDEHKKVVKEFNERNHTSRGNGKPTPTSN